MRLKRLPSRWKSLTLFVITFGFAVLCTFLFVISFSRDFKYILFGGRSQGNVNVNLNSNEIRTPETWVDKLIRLSPTITAVFSATGTVSSGILAWRISRRDARERDLKIESLELQLKALKGKDQKEAV